MRYCNAHRSILASSASSMFIALSAQNFADAPFFSPTLGPDGEPIGGNTQSVGNATGLDTVRTPRNTMAVSAAYRVPLAVGRLNFTVSTYYNSGFAWDPDNRPRQSGYDVANASIDWEARGNAWSVRLWGSNFAGTRYCAEARRTDRADERIRGRTVAGACTRARNPRKFAQAAAKTGHCQVLRTRLEQRMRFPRRAAPSAFHL